MQAMTYGNSVTLPGYVIQECVYNSSRTQAYRAVRTANQQPVMVKVAGDVSLTASGPSLLHHQYVLSQQLTHPGLVKITALVPWDNRHAIVMPDDGSVSLAQYLRETTEREITERETTKNAESSVPLSLTEVLSIGVQLADILHYLEQQRVIHKDIKPANILIHPQSKQIKLIDFSIASQLPTATQALTAPDLLEGTLAYIAPEQTGRINRGIDYRSDFYALGVTLYQLLTGRLPFESEDPLELVHCHLAKQPPPIQTLRPGIPQTVVAIVAKLMAKTAEERYQSATGLRADLELCLHQWKETGAIADIVPGRLDDIARFNIPQRLYGREQSVRELLAAFERVCEGDYELVVIKGYSGVGKTALVQALLERLTASRGYFATGKYDQLQRDAPLAVPTQPLRQSVQQLLTEPQARLDYWRDRILNALGEHARLMVEVIPELEHIVGPQPEVAPLEGAAAAMRFGKTFNQFAQCLSGPDHPYVCFVDDWQWADSASYEGFSQFAQDLQNGYFLSVIAYRDNEVGPTHPLMQMLETIRQAGVRTTEICLEPLEGADVSQLVADTLHREPSEVAQLADVLFQKTEGNPFFLTQLLISLHSDGLVWFDAGLKQWQWNLDAIQQAGLTDNVVELMVDRLSQLPKATHQLLSLSACIGNRFDLHTLAIIAEQTPAQVAQGLLPALQASFMTPLDETYKAFLSADLSGQAFDLEARDCAYRFSHDRIQQAAYALIPAEQVEQTHYKIAKLLQSADPAPSGKALMALVGHANAARACLKTTLEREWAAQLNLSAGQQAQASAAYAAAYDYYQMGLGLLSDESWNNAYDLTLALHQAAAKVALLIGEFDAVEPLVQALLAHTCSVLERVDAYQIQIYRCKAQMQMATAIDLGLESLRLLGIDLPVQPSSTELTTKIQQFEAAWAGRTVEELAILPEMSDRAMLKAMDILRELTPAAYFANHSLLQLIPEQQLDLMLTYGSCAVGAIACSTKAAKISIFQQNWKQAERYANTARALLSRFEARQYSGMVNFTLNYLVDIGNIHLKEAAAQAQTNIVLCVETGDIEHATYSALNYLRYSLTLETALDTFEQRAAGYYHQLKSAKQNGPLKSLRILWQSAQRLLAQPIADKVAYNNDPSSPQFEPQIFFDDQLQNLFYRYLLGDWSAAREHAALARPHAANFVSQLCYIQFCFYDSLNSLACYPQADATEQQRILERVEQYDNYLRNCAVYAPMNYQHKVDLIAAERYRVLGNRYEALDAYDQAIDGATEQGFVQEAAMANERAAEFYKGLGKAKIAKVYWREAYQLYQQWGAIAKLDQLTARYPWLVQTTVPVGSPSITLHKSSSTLSAQLDLETFIKAAKALSREIVLDRLLEKLLQLMLENAAAQKGCIVLEKAGDWIVEVVDVDAAAQVIEQRSVAVAASTEVPQSLIHYVARTGEPRVIADALKEPTLQADPYIQQQQPRSVLCLPMRHQGQTVGIVYLENNSVTNAFISEHVKVLNLLASQAVIALQNAQLYQQSQESQRQMSTVLSSMPGMAYSCLNDEAWTMQYVSDGCLDLTGYPPADLLHNKKIAYAELIHPDDEATVVAAIEAALQAHQPFRMTYRIRTPDNQEKWVWEQGQALRDEQGEIVLLEGFIADISDRKQAELALQSSEAQLREQAQALEKAVQKLQSAQMQMIQSEKMSALGNLVAGVAHEINNPVGFLKGNIKPAQAYVNDLLGLIDLLLNKMPQLDEDIEEEIEAIDLDFVRKDLPELLGSMNLGVDRIKNISTSLRTFSRADKDHKTAFNLHEGIDSTILILKHRLKGNEQRPAVQVVKDYGDLPQVTCFPGQLNQVFMNILANAVDVFDEAAQQTTFAALKETPQIITIKTAQLEDNRLELRMGDNGKGMSADVKAKIFDHLYTTKGVGKGTGLGLAIARQIVEEKHGGTVTVESQVGHGTEFILTLPSNPS